MAEKINNKTQYVMIDEAGSSFNFYVVQNFDWQFTNTIAKYEKVGGRGGFAVNTGEAIRSITMNISLIGNLRQNFAAIKVIEQKKTPVTIFSNIDSSRLFGKYLIEGASTNILDGQDKLDVQITLVEYRDFNVLQSSLILNESKDFNSVLNRLENQNLIDGK